MSKKEEIVEAFHCSDVHCGGGCCDMCEKDLLDALNGFEEEIITEYQTKVRNRLLMLECMEDAVEIVDEIAGEMKEKK